MSPFTDALMQGWEALFSVDGVSGQFTPVGGSPADCRVIMTENSTVVEIGESVQTYRFEAKVLSSEIDTTNAQDGALVVFGITYYVVAVNQLNRLVAVFTLSDTPIHSS